MTIPPVAPADSVFGTVQVSGPAWVSSGATDWSQLSSTRPLVAGDRLRTGSDGYLLADLGEAGVVGLYGNAEIRANDSGQGPVIDVLKGKVAFHLSPRSNLQLKAQGAGIGSKATPADGYVEFDENGVPVVVVEEGSLRVQYAGMERELKRGERLALKSDAEPVQVAASDEEENRKKAAAVAAGGAAAGGAGGAAFGGLSAAAWTAIGVVAAATGGAIAVANEDSHASPSGNQ
ncbi:MAG: hypothetical protein D6815_10370 [Candidatus Dadabacteria bacterium]|nr:MAG: hypothetical protein D6815_10370 [Candidatus Dadabacteria bacterium]